jgi:hypothetical protein
MFTFFKEAQERKEHYKQQARDLLAGKYDPPPFTEKEKSGIVKLI